MQETPRAAQAWADYLALGSDRSLDKLLKRYQSEPNPPTDRLATLKQWSRRLDWQGRLRGIADAAAREVAEAQAEHRRRIMEHGFALDHERVQALDDLARIILGQLTAAGDDNRLWVTDQKSIIAGQEPVFADDGETMIGRVNRYEVLDIRRFNASQVSELRGLLEDLAKETGGRVQKSAAVVTHGGEVRQAVTIYLPANGRDRTD